MSSFGFAPVRHNAEAAGFSQAPDPFASLSGRQTDVHDALEFEDTYDGLGDQLDEADDAFNDDTFGGGGGAGGAMGKDFDFFGQTANVSDAIEQEHLRFDRQQPPQRSTYNYSHQTSSTFHASATQTAQPAQRSVRTGYEKYKEAEPVPELNVDQSIWGISSAKGKVQAPTPQPGAQPPLTSQATGGRKIMSLEEVEASIRAQSKKPAVNQPSPPGPHDYSHVPPGYSSAHPQPGAAAQVQSAHSHPVTILQRPQSLHSKPSPSLGISPAPAQEQQQTLPLPQASHHGQSVQPTQILQNPKRLSRDVSRAGTGNFEGHRQQNSLPGLSQLHAHPRLAQMTEEEKIAFLDQETKRAKRNHKIWLLSKDNGLMTPQDKNFITRIQLQQLISATGNPADQSSDTNIVEDFYYQVYSHIRAGQRQNPSQPLSNFAQTYLFQTGGRYSGSRRHGRPAENHFQRMEQQVQRAVEAAKNKPKNPQLVVAGSLGKISFSNAKTPKPLLNIKRNETETHRPTSGRKSPAKATGIGRRTILHNVEKVYDTLMQIEDHIRQMPPPISAEADQDLQGRHGEWANVFATLNAKLWDELKVHEPIGTIVPHPFIAFLSCDKGKKAIPRIFPHLSLEHRTTILTMIVYHLDQLDVVQGAAANPGETILNARMRANIDLFVSAVMPSLMQYFNDAGLDIVDGFLNLVATKPNVDAIARTRVGVSLLTLIISRAVLLKQTDAGDASQWEKW